MTSREYDLDEEPCPDCDLIECMCYPEECELPEDMLS